MANNKSTNSKKKSTTTKSVAKKTVNATKMTNNDDKKNKIIAIIGCIVIIIILLLMLTCCHNTKDTNKLKGQIGQGEKKKDTSKKKTKDTVDEDTTYRPSYFTYVSNERNGLVTLAYNSTPVEKKTAEVKDTTSPVARVIYSTEEITNDDVKVTIIASEEIKEVEGWTLSADKKSLSKIVSENESGEVTVTDKAGNTTIVNYEVNNIDKVAPTLSVSYGIIDDATGEIVTIDPTVPTNKNVVVTITANEEVEETEGWTLSEDKKSLTKPFEGNDSNNVTVTDLAGNTATIGYNVNNIDKVAPTLAVSYGIINEETGEIVTIDPTVPTNKNVVVTITANEEVEEVGGWTLSEDKKSLTTTFEENDSNNVTVIDKAGNEATINYNVNNIDKVAPNANVTYRDAGFLQKTIIITANEEIKEVEGWTLSEDEKSLIETVGLLEYIGTVTITDKAGNQTTVSYNAWFQ